MFNFSTTAVSLMSTYLTDRWQYVSIKRRLSNPPCWDHYCVSFMLTIYQSSSNILERRCMLMIFSFTLIALQLPLTMELKILILTLIIFIFVVCKKFAKIESRINVFLSGSQINIVNFARNCWWGFQQYANLVGVYSMLRCLWASQYYTPPKIRLFLAKTYLITTLLYTSEVFSCSNSKDTAKLNSAFNNIVHYIFCLRRFDHVSRFRQIYRVTLHSCVI